MTIRQSSVYVGSELARSILGSTEVTSNSPQVPSAGQGPAPTQTYNPSSPHPAMRYPQPPPRSDHTKIILAIIIAAVIIISVVALAVHYYDPQTSSNDGQGSQSTASIFVGAYLDYGMTGDVSGMAVTGSMDMEVINTTSEGFTMQTTTSETPGGTNVTTQWYSNSDPSNIGSSASSSGQGVLIDQEQMATALGNKEVNHYQNKTSSGTIDTYVTTDTDLLVKMQETMNNGNWIAVTLSSTNIPYYEG